MNIGKTALGLFTSIYLGAWMVGCATTQSDYDQAVQGVIVSALTRPIADIESRAAADDGQAQYELSILYVYGLRGKDKNLETASIYRTKAMRQRGREDQKFYRGASSNNSGGYSTRSVSAFHWIVSHADGINKCTVALSANSPDADKYCIGNRTVDEMRQLWKSANSGLR